jgi:hypothetical protein
VSLTQTENPVALRLPAQKSISENGSYYCYPEKADKACQKSPNIVEDPSGQLRQ